MNIRAFLKLAIKIMMQLNPQKDTKSLEACIWRDTDAFVSATFLILTKALSLLLL